MIADMLADPMTSRVAVKYLIDKVEPYTSSPLIGESAERAEHRIDPALDELRSFLDKPEIPKSAAPRLQFLADNVAAYAASVGVNVDDPNSIRAYVYLFVPLEEQAEFTWWEIDRIREEHAFTPIPEVAEMENLAKRIIMNLNVYMEVKQMALTGGDVSQDEIVSFEKALVSQMTKARGLIRNF